MKYLRKVDPDAAERARQRYACFDHFQHDTQSYGNSTGVRMSPSCEKEVVMQLKELCQQGDRYLRHEGSEATTVLFYAQQNARLVKNTEHYYRTMYKDRTSSWNL